MSNGRGRHKTVLKELKQSVSWLEAQGAVQRVILGRTENCRHAYTPGHLRVKSEVLGGLKVVGYGGEGVQDYFVKVQTPEGIEAVKRLILDRFS